MFYQFMIRKNFSIYYLQGGNFINNKFTSNNIIENLDIPKPIKLFNKDIIKKNRELVSSEIRNKILVGYFSTSQTIRFGKTKTKKIIYLVKPFEKYIPNFLVSYGGKLKGKLLIRFKFTHWNKKLPTGHIVNVIGYKDETNLKRCIAYNNQLDYKQIKLKPTNNILENKIVRQDLTLLNTYSIDPYGSKDIDDAFSYDGINIYIHIAQPIVYLNSEIIKNISKKRFSTLYLQDSEISLWGDKITQESSLLENEIRKSYTLQFNNKGEIINHFPSIIKLNKNYWYKEINKTSLFSDFFQISKLIFKKNILTAEKLIETWMIHTNCTIGKIIKNKNMIYRINDTDITKIDKNIKKKYYHASEYIKDDGINRHNILECNNYVHFTSPIRRLIDNIIHYFLTYDEIIEISLDKINILSKSSNKFHRTLELNKKINDLSSELITKAIIVNKITDYDWEIYIEEIGFIYYNILPYKLRKTEHIVPLLEIGDQFEIQIQKKKGFLPYEKINILSKFDLY